MNWWQRWKDDLLAGTAMIALALAVVVALGLAYWKPKSTLVMLQGCTGPCLLYGQVLDGKPLRYLIGSGADIAGEDGEVTEVGYDATRKPTSGVAIKYGNLFDEKNTGQLGPYMRSGDVASEYHEGQIDPRGAGWIVNLKRQFTLAARQGFNIMELDNPDAYTVTDVLGAVDLAETYNIAIVAKNPGLTDRPLAYVFHRNIVGIIVERGAGTAGDMELLRKRAGKPTMPVWFVYYGGGRGSALGTASKIKAGGYVNMGVTYSNQGEYGTSADILRPVAPFRVTPVVVPASLGR